MESTPSAYLVKPFIKGQPRVKYDHLEFVEDEASYEDEGAHYHQGKPFTGIAWNENRGIITEDTFKEGLKNGRCIRVYPNGQLAEDGIYKDDFPVGKVLEWHESGVLWHEYMYGDYARKISHREYNARGVLVFESNNKGVKLWYPDGILMHEYVNGSDKYYAPNGDCVIATAMKKDPGEHKAFWYDDEALYKHVHEMLNYEALRSVVIKWLQSKLDLDDPHACRLLISLLDHPVPDIVSTALSNIGFRGYKDAIPRISLLIEKHRRSLTHVFLAAKLAYARLTGEGDTTRITDDYYAALTKLKKAEDLRRLKVKKTWPKAEAYFLETYPGMMIVKSGQQLFSEETLTSHVEYKHVYRYFVNNYSYRITLGTTEEKPALVKMVRYRRKNPSEAIFDNDEN